MTYAVVHREWVWKQPWSSILILERSRRSGWHTSWKHTVANLSWKKVPFLNKAIFSSIIFSHMYNNSCIITKSINIISSKRKCCHVKRIYTSTCSESYRTGGISWSKFTLRSMIRGGEVTQWIKMFKKVPKIKELFSFSKYGQAKGRPVVL